MRGMLWNIRLSNDSTATAQDGELEFELSPDSEQYLVLLFPTDRIAQNGLLYDVARHNFTSFVVKDFDLEQMNFGRLGLLIIKGFTNLNEINHYRQVMAQSKTFTLPPEVRPVVISAANFDTLIKSGRSFDDYFKYMQDKTYRDTEEAVLPPDLFGPSEGIPDEEETPAEASGENEAVGEDTPDKQPAEPAVENQEAAPAAPEVHLEAEEQGAPAPEPSKEEPAKEEPARQEPVNTPEPVNKPEQVKTPEPAQPAPKPEEQKPAAPATQKPKPEAPAQNKKKETPKTPAPSLPEYPDGSEGDDPLLE